MANIGSTSTFDQAPTGTPLFLENATTTTSGAEITIISHVATSLTKLSKIMVTCRQAGIIKIYDDTSLIGSARLNAANLNYVFTYEPFREVETGNTIEVRYTQRAGTNSSDIEAYLMALEL